MLDTLSKVVLFDTQNYASIYQDTGPGGHQTFAPRPHKLSKGLNPYPRWKVDGITETAGGSQGEA